MTNSDFLAFVGNLAKSDMEKTKVLASLTIAQGILESGWGKSTLALYANNLFGMKATTSWMGRIYNAETKESFDGTSLVSTTANFKAYDNWEESIADHSTLFVNSSRYKKVVGELDYKIACQEVKNAGYATDPDYPNKLIALIEQYKLYDYDIPDVKEPEEHWAKLYENILISKGVVSKEKNLDEPPTRGEVYVALCNIAKL